MSNDLMMSVSTPDGKGGTIDTGPFKASLLSKLADDLRTEKPKRTPMKNTPADKAVTDTAYRATAEDLRQFIERIERLDAEKKDLAEQQKEVMAEAKGRGYDTKVMRKIIALRKRDSDDVAEEEAVLDFYKETLGM